MLPEGASQVKPAITITNPPAHPEWERPDLEEAANPNFHGRQRATILNKSYGFAPFYMDAPGDGVRRGMLPLIITPDSLGIRTRDVALPFTDFCEPCAADKSSPRPVFIADEPAERSVCE
jgi:hypothetical protein